MTTIRVKNQAENRTKRNTLVIKRNGKVVATYSPESWGKVKISSKLIDSVNVYRGGCLREVYLEKCEAVLTSNPI